MGGLVFQLLAAVVGADALLDLAVDGLLDEGLDSFELGGEDSDVLGGLSGFFMPPFPLLFISF